MYAKGFSMEYLTPACAAKLTTISGFFSSNILSKFSRSVMSDR
jgi:hypothetical protein